MSAARRWILVVLALGAAACLVIAVEGGRWFWAGDSIALGPSGALACFDGVCETHDLAGVDASETWRRAGIGTTGAGLLAGIALVALAGALAAKRGGKLAAGATITATLTGLVAAAVFVAKRPEIGVQESLGRGVVLFAIGTIVAMACAVIVVRQR